MSKEFKYNVEEMKNVASNLKNVSASLEYLNNEFNGAKELIQGMESLGFLEKKAQMLNTIHSNTQDKSAKKINRFGEIVSKNASDVLLTDKAIASKMEKGGKWVLWKIQLLKLIYQN